jgi:hypothetical protein
MVEVESTNHIGKPWPKLSQAAGRSLMLQMRQPRGMNIRLLGLRRAINDLLTVVDHARQRWAGHFRLLNHASANPNAAHQTPIAMNLAVLLSSRVAQIHAPNQI